MKINRSARFVQRQDAERVEEGWVNFGPVSYQSAARQLCKFAEHDLDEGTHTIELKCESTRIIYKAQVTVSRSVDVVGFENAKQRGRKAEET